MQGFLPTLSTLILLGFTVGEEATTASFVKGKNHGT